MKLDLKTREQLRDLNAQQWADFKAHWPMHFVEIFKDLFLGTLLGAALGLSLSLYALQQVTA